MTRVADECAQILRDQEAITYPGLTDQELEAAEREFQFEFGEDHRALLRIGVPLGSPNWRDLSDPKLAERMEAPMSGVLFDVDENGFWAPSWGVRPGDPAAARETAAHQIATWPQLIPVYGHRYTPAGAAGGAPVLSIVQTDVIVFGDDLAAWARIEFLGEKPTTALAWDALLPWTAFAFGRADRL